MNNKYLPDVSAMLREIDPGKRRQDRRQALENLQRPTPPDYLERFEPEPREGDAGAGAGVGKEARTSAQRQKSEPAPARRSRTWRPALGLALVGATMPFLVLVAGKTKDVPGQAVTSASAIEPGSSRPRDAPSVTAAPSVAAAPGVAATAAPSPTVAPAASVAAATTRLRLRPPKQPAPRRPEADQPPKDVTAPSAPKSNTGTQDPGLNE